MYRFVNKNGLISENHVKYIVLAPSRRVMDSVGGLSGLIWNIRSGMRQQKNEWGIGLGIFENIFENNIDNHNNACK